jgi:hypothetical protein
MNPDFLRSFLAKIQNGKEKGEELGELIYVLGGQGMSAAHAALVLAPEQLEKIQNGYDLAAVIRCARGGNEMNSHFLRSFLAKTQNCNKLGDLIDSLRDQGMSAADAALVLAPEQLAKIQDDYQLNYVIGVLGGNEMNPDYAKLLLNGGIGEKFPRHEALQLLGARARSASSSYRVQSKAAFVTAFIQDYSSRSKDGVCGSIFRNTNFLRQLLLLGTDDKRFTCIKLHYTEKSESRTTTVVKELLKKDFSNFSSHFGRS